MLRMKIAFLVGVFPSLSETFILNQVTGLLDAGHQVDIYAFHRPAAGKVQTEIDAYRLLERTTYFDIPISRPARLWKAIVQAVVNIPKNPRKVFRAMDVRKYGRGFSIKMLYMLKPFIEKGPYDIIHCHFGTVGRAGAQLKRLGIAGKLIVTFHGKDISQVPAQEGSAVYQALFDNADLIMPVSDFWKQKLIRMGAKPDLVQVHRMGIDLQQFSYRPRSLNRSGEIRILTVGRLVEKKGIRYALEAVALLLRRHPEWKLCYDIIGEGPQCAEIKETVTALGLQKQVNLHGAGTMQEVHRHVQNAHLFLLPSVTDKSGDQEGIPVSLMEAMATGLPILSTVHTGIPELVQDGVSGYLVAEGDVQALAEKLEYLILNPELWPLMGRKGRARVAELHDIRTLNQQLLAAYERLFIGQNGGSQS
jgi:colanic acid/amylovoran biosynthesis glycosyltransferase